MRIIRTFANIHAATWGGMNTNNKKPQHRKYEQVNNTPSLSCLAGYEAD